MRNYAYVAIAFAVLAALISWVNLRSTTDIWRVGTLETTDLTGLVALTNSQSDLTADRYDSYESPRGTDYQVPTGETLYITTLHGTADAAVVDLHIQVGYGDDAVNDAVGAPTNSVTVFEFTWRDAVDAGGGQSVPISVWIPIPADKYPWVRPLNVPMNIQATGIAQ